MIRRYYPLAVLLGLFFAAGSYAQHPVMDMIANKVIQKYQTSSCEQLWEKKGQPKSQQEQEFVQMLRQHPEQRTAFIDKVAPSIANKMFDCGMIP